MRRRIEIPELKEYGWVLGSEGALVFKPTRKVIQNRIKFIVESRGTTLERRTLGFSVTDASKLTEDDLDMIRKELLSVGGVEVPDEITINKSGREEPNFE